MIGIFRSSLGIVLLAALTTGCASTKNSSEGAAPPSEPDVAALRAAYQADLEKIVRRELEAAGREADLDRVRLVRRRPYYLKECAAYPSVPETLNVEMHETESRTRPYQADVTGPKVRLSSRPHTKKEDARKDTRIFRDTGMETLTYEMRSGQWKRIGGIFVADKTEEYINGEWLPRMEEVKRTTPAEPPKGWLKSRLLKLIGRGD